MRLPAPVSAAAPANTYVGASTASAADRHPASGGHSSGTSGSPEGFKAGSCCDCDGPRKIERRSWQRSGPRGRCSVPPGGHVAWQFVAPSGDPRSSASTRVAGLTDALSRTGRARGRQFSAEVWNPDSGATLVRGSGCRSCDHGGDAEQRARAVRDGSRVGLRCHNPTGCLMGQAMTGRVLGASVRLARQTVTLQDLSPPVIPGSVVASSAWRVERCRRRRRLGDDNVGIAELSRPRRVPRAASVPRSLLRRCDERQPCVRAPESNSRLTAQIPRDACPKARRR